MSAYTQEKKFKKRWNAAANPQGAALVRTLLRRLVLRQLRHVLVQQVGQRLGVGQQLLVGRGELLVLLVPVLAQLPFGM